MPWATFFEIGSDVAGLLSGIAFALPTLNVDKLQSGIAALENDLKALGSRFASASPPAPQSAPVVTPVPAGQEKAEVPAGQEKDAAEELVQQLLTVPRSHLSEWSRWASICLRVGAGMLIIAFGMKLAFYAVREDVPPACSAGKIPVCENARTG